MIQNDFLQIIAPILCIILKIAGLILTDIIGCVYNIVHTHTHTHTLTIVVPHGELRYATALSINPVGAAQQGGDPLQEAIFAS